MKHILILALFILVGCSTVTKFKIPKDHTLVVDGETISSLDTERYVRSPMFWDKTGGIPYQLKKDGQVKESGKLKAKFRIVSIFWPPFGLIYWPMGFDEGGYDFTNKDSKVRKE
jgi:hypothetical protein